MSGVKNLRAMFEQKGDSSPPQERGRSPGLTSNGTESPRPLSRVHTSFIAIEKDGRIGLQRDASRDSNISLSTRKTSGEQEGIPPPSIVEEPATPAEKTPVQANFRSRSFQDPPRSDPANQSSSGTPTSKPAAVKAQAPTSTPVAKPNAEETRAKAVPGPAASKPATTSQNTTLRNGEATNGTSDPKGKGKAAAKESSITAAGGASKAATRSVPIMITKTTSKPTKSPTVAKAPKSPALAAPKLNSKAPDRKAGHPEKTATTRPTAGAAKASSSTSVNKPPPLHANSSGIGFIKPKVKSPTRPVKLPAGLTTHTAASGSKVNASRQSLSRQSGVYNPNEAQGRSPSRVSVSTAGTTRTAGTGGKSLRRQNSTINRPRPSFGPPPKPSARDHPVTKREKEVDEGFLSRMMRPTQASSSKTADRVAVTPPRKTAAAPVVKRAIPSEALKTLKKHPAKTTSTLASSSNVKVQPAPRVVPASIAGPSSAKKESTPAAAAAPVVKRPVTPEPTPAPAVATPAAAAAQPVTPEPATSTAKHIETPVSSPEVVNQETTAQDIAPVVEKLETAEEATEVAKEAEGEAVPPPEEKEPSSTEATPSKAVEETEEAPAPAVSPEAEVLEHVEVDEPKVNGDHEKSAAPAEPESADQSAVSNEDEPEVKEIAENVEETAA